MKEKLKNKKLRIIVSALCFLLLASTIVAVSYLLLLSKPSKFSVVTQFGTVMYKQNGSSEYVEITSDLDLESGTWIKTQEDTLAFIFFPDNSMLSVESNTELEVSVKNNSIKINQLIGNTWHRVETVTNGGEYEVSTPEAIASVRGTKFNINVSTEDKIMLYVEQDTVEFSKCSTPKFFTEGYLVQTKQLDSECEFVDGVDIKELKESKWYLKNILIDKLFDENKNDLKQKLKDLLEKSEEFKLLQNEQYPDYLNNILNAPSVEITSPQSLSDISTCNDSIEISGIISANAYLKINNNEVENEKENFSILHPLALGENKITVTAMNKYTAESADVSFVAIRTSCEQSPTNTYIQPNPPTTTPSLVLNSSKSSLSIYSTWTFSNLDASAGFYLMMSQNPNPNLEDSEYVELSSRQTSYDWQVNDGSVYYFKICTKKNNSCEINSNVVKVTAPKNTFVDITSTSTNSIQWQTTGNLPTDGFVVIYSKTSGVTYPPRTVDHTATIADIYANSYTYFYPYEGSGNYFVKVCAFSGNSCTAYSTEKKVYLDYILY